MRPIPEDEFIDLVEEALETLPPDFLDALDNVAVVVEDEDPEEPELLGLYEGIPQVERFEYAGVLPDKISIFRIPLCAHARDEDDLIEEVRVTVVHELAHHLGIDDERLHDLGWA